MDYVAQISPFVLKRNIDLLFTCFSEPNKIVTLQNKSAIHQKTNFTDTIWSIFTLGNTEQ